MKKRIYIGTMALLAALFLAPESQAQLNRNRAQTSLTGGLQTSIPLGAFGDQYADTPVGLGASFTTPVFRNSPIHAGFGFGWNRIDRDEQDIFIPDQEGLNEADYEVTTNRYSYDLHMRLSPLNGRFQPFFEGVVGWSNYITRTDLNTTFSNGEIMERTERLHNDVSWNYGWGVGLHYRLAPHIFLEGKVQRLYATETSFMDHESLMISPTGEIEYDMIENRPEFLTIQVGITLKL